MTPEARNGVLPEGNVPETAIGFLDPTVDVRELDQVFWSVLREFEYRGKRERFRVPVGQRTDFASVPRPLVWFIPRYGRYTKAAVLHDRLCDLSQQGQFERRDADGVFRQAMRALGVPFLRRWIMWAAVRWGALVTADGRKGWLRDAPSVLPITLIVGPIVAPAVLVILITQLVWFLAEVALWGPLKLIERVQRQRKKETKRVNPPSMSWRV